MPYCTGAPRTFAKRSRDRGRERRAPGDFHWRV